MTGRQDELEQRLVELELRYTHQARQLDELSEVMYEQRQLIDQLRSQVDRLRHGGDGGDHELSLMSRVAGRAHRDTDPDR